MLEVIKYEKARFRIQIYDLREKKTKTISLRNNDGYNLEHVKNMVENCFNKRLKDKFK